MKSDDFNKKKFYDLSSLNLISCNHLLDTCGSDNLPTSGHLTLSAITNESQKLIHKFLAEKLI